MHHRCMMLTAPAVSRPGQKLSIIAGAETVCNCLTEGSIGAMLFLGSECYAELTYQNIK